MEETIEIENQFNIERGELVAAKLFHRIGIAIEWRARNRSCPADRDPLLLRISTHTPADYWPGTYALSFPYEGIHLQIFYDRMQAVAQGSMLIALAGHAMAHEIAHVLEGAHMHSTGIMKRRFDSRDIQHMALDPLSFSPRDIILLHDGVQSRHVRLSELQRDRLDPPQVVGFTQDAAAVP
ncbi:MAG TPA: hypothetical protein VJ732_02025 [Bryobacteraceae bacterium]|nr:hypothetical protein [Bryobacteraceae bacterium]